MKTLFLTWICRSGFMYRKANNPDIMRPDRKPCRKAQWLCLFSAKYAIITGTVFNKQGDIFNAKI